VVIASRRSLVALGAATLGIAAFGVWFAIAQPTTAIAHFADADDPGMVTPGKKIYSGHCASCHGRNLQGQPLWQLIDGYAGRRAPAHDETGHTWQHSDEDIFHLVKYGRFPSAPAGVISFMPPAKGVLSDREILNVIAFIKARWPIGLRASQAMLNPGRAGMPRQASSQEWTLPPTCNALLRQRSADTAKTNADAAVPTTNASANVAPSGGSGQK
jgi:S-disulfanyl-L-cysteine oxidoreductase SoxD